MANVVEEAVFEQFKAETFMRIEKLQAELTEVKQQPKKWMVQSEAMKLFTGRGGQPLHRTTFNAWITKWLKSGVLKVGVNAIPVTGGGYLISEDFLAGRKR